MNHSAKPSDPPPGFVDMFDNEPFETLIGPILYRDGDGKRVGGFRAQAKHANTWNIVHGGMLTAFADSAMTGIDFYGRDGSLEGVVTVTLNCEFVGPAYVGEWIECHGEIVRRGKSMIFMQGRLTVDDRVIMTCSTVLKRVAQST
jgi:uncharacterized protein (TIGR00369 family)